jgi:hypothetical protein
MSSQGILVLNPGHIDPGYCGPLTVRAINLGATTKPIDLGARIFTVVFERLTKETSKPYPALQGSREERENKFSEMDFAQNPHSLGRLLEVGSDKPLMTGDEVDRRIREHWYSKATLIGTLMGVILAAIAALFAVIGVYRADAAKPSAQNTSSSSPSPSPSVEPSVNASASVTPSVTNDKIKKSQRNRSKR